MSRLKKLNKSYKSIHYSWNGLYNATWNSTALTEDEPSREKRRIIETKIHEIRHIISDVYGPKVGAEVLNEIRNGETRD